MTSVSEVFVHLLCIGSYLQAKRRNAAYWEIMKCLRLTFERLWLLFFIVFQFKVTMPPSGAPATGLWEHWAYTTNHYQTAQQSQVYLK